MISPRPLTLAFLLLSPFTFGSPVPGKIATTAPIRSRYSENDRVRAKELAARDLARVRGGVISRFIMPTVIKRGEGAPDISEEEVEFAALWSDDASKREVKGRASSATPFDIRDLGRSSGTVALDDFQDARECCLTSSAGILQGLTVLFSVDWRHLGRVRW